MHDDLKLETRDKVLQKMSRNGAVEQNVSRGTTQNVSSRIAEVAFDKTPDSGSDLEWGRGAKVGPQAWDMRMPLRDIRQEAMLAYRAEAMTVRKHTLTACLGRWA